MTEVQQALDDFVRGRTPETMFLAKVTYAIDDGPYCHAEDEEGIEIFDIRLQPQLLNGSETYIFPKVGSWILVGSLRGKPSYICLMVTEIDYMQIVAGDSVFKISDVGFLMKKGGETLAKIEADLLDELKNLTDALQALTVTCAGPGSPSSPPVNVASFAAVGAALSSIKTRFNDLLKTS